MNIITAIISLFLFFALVAAPIVIIKRQKNSQNKFLGYFIPTIIITTILWIAFAWWADFSNELLLKYYGYNFEGMNAQEYYANVSSEDLEKVHEIERSMGGIGWPLKAIIMAPLFFIYSLVVYFAHRLLWRKTKTQ